MEKSTNHCCYSSEWTPWCDNRRAEGAVMCEHHLKKVIRDAMFDGVLPTDAMVELAKHGDWLATVRTMFPGARLVQAQAAKPKRDVDGCVYYVRLSGGRIKIGYTSDLPTRMATFRAQPTDILATEPGDRLLESIRHQQFTHLRIGRLEEFHPEPDLLEHISDTRQRHGDPAQIL